MDKKTNNAARYEFLSTTNPAVIAVLIRVLFSF